MIEPNLIPGKLYKLKPSYKHRDFTYKIVYKIPKLDCRYTGNRDYMLSNNLGDTALLFIENTHVWFSVYTAPLYFIFYHKNNFVIFPDMPDYYLELVKN
jgi:hypothetical protein